MAEFPKSPVPPAEFFERFLPEAFAAAELAESLSDVELALGVRLEGAGGGEWLLQLAEGALRVEPGSRTPAVLTVVQSVADWRGALWEGRGGAIGRHASSVFRPGAAAALGALGLGGPPPASALAQIQALQGVLRVCVTHGEGGDWSVAVKLGPGEIPAEPTTTVSLRAEDADALASGELGALEAFMGGRIQVAGDVTLLMQIQALQLELSSARPAPGTRRGA